MVVPKGKPFKLKGKSIPVFGDAQKHQGAEKHKPTFRLAVL